MTQYTVFCHLLIVGIITDKLRASQMSALPIFLMFPPHTTRPLITSPESMQRKMHNNGKTAIKKQSRRCTEDVPLTTGPPPKHN